MFDICLRFVGFAAAVLSTIAFLPQAVYTIRTKDTASISLATYAIFVGSVVFWLIYGFMLMDWPIILSNIVCVILSGIIMVYKIIEVVKNHRAKKA